MRKILYWGFVITGCLIGGILFLLGDGVVIGRDENQNDKNLELGIWVPGTTFEQTFVASRNNLCRIDFALDSYHPWDVPYLDCYLFEIAAPEDPHILTYEFISKNIREARYKRMNGWLLSYHMFNGFSFAPIADSQGKRYLFTIRAPEVKKGGSSILLASPGERYEDGHLFVNREKQKGDLAFRVLYEQPRIQVIRQSFARLALQKPFPFSTPVAYYGVFLIYIILLVGFLGLLTFK